MMRKLVLGIADGEVYCDSQLAYEASDIRVALFKQEGEIWIEPQML